MPSGGLSNWWWWCWRSCPVSQMILPVTLRKCCCIVLRKTFRNHVNAATEASSCAKLFASEISWCNCAWFFNTTAQLFRRNSFRYLEIRSDQAKLSSKGFQKWRWANPRQKRTDWIGKMRKFRTAGSNSE